MTGLTIAVTGSTGFVGSRLMRDLEARGHVPVALVRRPPGGSESMHARLVDFAQAASLADALHGVDAIIHLAGRAHVMRDQGDAEAAYHRDNVVLSANVAEAAVRAGVSRLIYASSVKVYGDVEFIDSTTPPSPADAYGRSKLEAERAMERTLSPAGIAFTAIRFPLLYGPQVKGNVRRLFDHIAARNRLPMRGLTQPRSMLGLSNLMEVVAGTLQAHWAGGVCLPTDGYDVSPQELVTAIGRSLGIPARLLPAPVGLLRLGGRVGDVLSRVMPWPLTSADVARLTRPSVIDSTRTWAALHAAPAVSVETELQHTADWYRQLSGT